MSAISTLLFIAFLIFAPRGFRWFSQATRNNWIAQNKEAEAFASELARQTHGTAASSIATGKIQQYDIRVIAIPVEVKLFSWEHALDGKRINFEFLLKEDKLIRLSLESRLDQFSTLGFDRSTLDKDRLTATKYVSKFDVTEALDLLRRTATHLDKISFS